MLKKKETSHLEQIFSLVTFSFFTFLRWGSPKGEEDPTMFWEFLFSCSFSLFCGSFWKCQKEHKILGTLKEKEKLAKFLLFHADSPTLAKVDKQHETDANCLQAAAAASNTNKQTHFTVGLPPHSVID